MVHGVQLLLHPFSNTFVSIIMKTSTLESKRQKGAASLSFFLSFSFSSASLITQKGKRCTMTST